MLNFPSWVPAKLCEAYVTAGVPQLFTWQLDLLSKANLRAPHYSNLIFSAPTSSGKTIVAELIAVDAVLKKRQKAIFVFPYISVAKEKFLSLQVFVSDSSE